MKTVDYLLKDIPEDMHRQFKAKCVQAGHSMRNVLFALIGDYTANGGRTVPTPAKRRGRATSARV